MVHKEERQRLDSLTIGMWGTLGGMWIKEITPGTEILHILCDLCTFGSLCGLAIFGIDQNSYQSSSRLSNINNNNKRPNSHWST